MQRVNVGLLCLSSLLFASVAAAQTAVQPTEDVGSASLQNFSGGATIRGTYFDVRHQSGSGVGYQNGYTQIGAFTPFWLNEDSFIASNSRLLLTDTSEVGVNSGLVARRYSDATDRIFGINGYFDADKSTLNNRYRQATLGFETLGQGWDFRANGYIGLGKTDRFIREICVGGDPFFAGNQIAFLGQQLREESLSGADFEFGFPVFQATPWLRAYAGMYGYQSSSKEPIGVRGRMEAWVSDDLSVAVNVTDDRQFGTNVNAVVDFRFAGFRPTRYFPQWSTRERMLMPVQRNWRVATDTYVQDINIAAVNPADGLPYFVSHINNTAAAGGDGSFEHPFNTLPASVPGADLILVAAGTTTEGAPLTGSIALEDNQRMLGEGKAHMANMFATYGGCDVNGVFVLPGATNSGNYPFLSSAGNIITLANNNEVAGFNLLNAGGDAITNTAAGSNNFLLQCLEISGNGGVGINLQNATGTGIIRGVNLMSMSTNHPNPSGFGNNLGGGIFVGVGAGDLDLSLTNVAMNSDPAGTQAFGIHLQETGRNLVATLNNVQSSGNAGVGVQVLGDGGRITLTANTPGGPLISNDNGGDNLNITLINGTLFQGDIVGGQFNRSLLGSGVVYNHSGGVGELNFLNLQANDNAIDGIALIGSNATAMDVNVFGSFLTNNAEDGIHVQGTTGSTTGLFVDASDVRFNGRDGLFFNLNTATLNVTSTSNLMDNNDRSAIFGQMDASIADLLFSNTTGNLSGEHGLFLDAANGSTADIAVLSGTLADSSRLAPGLFDGVHIESSQSIVNLRMADTPANNTLVPPLGTQRHGMFLDIVNGSTFIGQVTNGNFTNSLENALNANFAGNSIATLVLDNTPLDNSGADGMHITLTGAATDARITLQNGSTNDNSGEDGLDFNVNNGRLDVNAIASSFTNSGQATGNGNGILGVIDNTGLVNLNFQDTPITGSFNSGVFVTANGPTLAAGSNIVAIFDNSSLSDNGATTNGDGLRFDLNGSPGSSLSLINGTNVDRNGGDGIELNATNGTLFQANFDALSISDNGQTAGTGNGVVANVDVVGGGGSTVNLTFNAATIVNNAPNATQQIGFEFDVRNGGTLTADFAASNLSNNSANAFNGFVTGAGSTSLVTLDATVADNSGNDGAVLLVTAGGHQDFRMTTGSSIDNSGGVGLLGTIDGVNSLANISLDASTIDSSTLFGAFLNVTGGATLNLSGANISSISDSGLTGIDVTSSDANTVVNIDFSNMSVDANGLVFGGAGLNGAAFNGGTLNGCFDNTSFSGNSREGVNLTIADAASLGQFGVNTSAFDNNGREGLLVDVSNSGVLNYRSQNTSYSGNGATGTFDGVNATVTGTGAADTITTARFLFSNDTVNGNTDDGFEFNANNGATLVTSLDTATATGNAGFGLNFNANDPGTKAYLLMTGANQLAPNTLGAMDLNIGTIDTAVLSISGNFSNNNGDGLFLDLTGVTNAAVAIHGPGTTIDGNLDNGGANPEDNGDGIDIRMSGSTNGSILITGVTSIDNNAADGIHIEMTNVLNGALEINGPTTINNSGDDAIDITLTGTTLVNGLVFPVLVPPVQFLTLGSNLSADPLDTFNFCLPQPVNLDLAAIRVVPLNAFTINGITADASVGRGINIRGVNSTIAPNLFTAAANDNGMAITNNVVNNSQAGDGLHIDFNNVTGPGVAPLVGVRIDGNSFDTNSGNGINLDLVNSPIDQLTITNNRSGVTTITGLDFLIAGNTFPGGVPSGTFTIGNTSGPGVDITGFTFDVSTIPATPAAPFINYDASGFGGFPFTPFGGTDATTGLTTVNSTAVPPYPNTLVPTGSQLVDFTFNDFNPGEQFQWDADLDPDLGQNGSIFGNDLIGATINVNFTGGLTLGGSMVAVGGDPTASTFVATSGNLGGSGIANNGLDGIRFSLNNSSLTNMVMSGNQIEANGTTGTGHGVNFQTVTNSDITAAVVSNNTIDGNAGDGFRLVNPNTAGAPIGLTFQDNTITTNTGAGIELQLNSSEVANVHIESLTTGNQISNNGSFGLHLDGQNTAQINLAMDGAGAANVLDANRDAGVGINLVNATTGSITVANSTFSNTTNGANALFNGGGMEVRLADTAAVTPFTIGDAVLNNVTFSNNAANGFSLLLNDNSTANNLLIQNISSLQNAQNQVRIDRRANAVVNVTMNDSTLTGSATSLDGFSYNATNFATATPLAINLNRNTISTNRDGVAIDTSANAVVVANIIENTISNNRNNGIRVTTLNASSFGDPSNGAASQLLGNTISNNGTADGAAGIRLIAQDVSFQNVLIGASAGGTRTTLTGNVDGIRITDTSATNPFSTPDNNYQIQATTIVDSVNDGIQLDLSGVGTRVYIGNPTAAATAARNDVVISRTNAAPGGTGHGINLNAENGANNVSIRNATIAYSGLSGVNVAQTGGDLTFNMQATNVLFSGERGLFANITGNRGTTGNNYNVGGTGANEGVLIQNSGQQGILFRTQSPISVSALRNLGTQTYGGGAQIDPLTPNVIRARLNIVNSQIIANGTVGNVNSDGVVLAVGTNTQQDVLMAGNAINGNVLDDLRIFSFASQNTQNDSVDNPVAAPGPNDILRLDPIARLGLVFGSIQSAYDSTTMPPMTNPQFTPLIPQGLFPSQVPNPIVLATRNTGEQINVTTIGSAATAGIANSNGTFTTGGVFTNAGRSTSMNGQVQIGQFPGPGLSDTSTFADSRNQFVQFMIEQNLDAAFNAGGFILNPANVFP
ncbi:MAG: right-handed parallel beta-helix repeat-containing protein [Planctomycetales bacterium]|nr:right-handed parallel beta-helix repeat-containing protein [Planctomycetales bacterium]